MYDVNGDGYISNGDLFHILKVCCSIVLECGAQSRDAQAMVGNNLTDVQLQQLVDRTISEGDVVSDRVNVGDSNKSRLLVFQDKDGMLSYDEFREMVKKFDLEEKLYISLDS